MKTSKTTKVSIRVMMIFVVAIIMSFIGDSSHYFFGDWYCSGYIVSLGKTIACDYSNATHQIPLWHWGYRHWIFFFMGFCLMIIQIVDIVTMINKTTEQ